MDQPGYVPDQGLSGRSVEGLCLVAVIGSFLFTGWSYFQLPQEVPSHFDAAGDPDDYRPRLFAWLLPITSLLTYLALTWLGRRPQLFNYPVTITPVNAAVQYANGVWMVRLVKTLISIGLAVLIYFQQEVSLGQAEKLPSWLLPSMAAPLLILSVFFFVRSLQLANNERQGSANNP